MDLIKLGEILQQKRDTLGLPATTVARRAGIARTTLWKVERGEDPRTGKPSRLSKDKLERLLTVLGVDRLEQVSFLQLAGYENGEVPSTSSVHVPAKNGILSGAFFFPGSADEDLEIAVLIEELKEVFQNPALSQKQRTEMVKLIHSFIGWLKFQSQASM